jgi:uncharacterized protein (TIGR02285 family)
MKTLLLLFFATLILFGLNLYRLQSSEQQRTAVTPNSSLTAQLPALQPDEHMLQIQQSSSRQFRIQWGTNPEAPFFILDGPEQGAGFCDVLLERMQVYLPDVRHQVLIEPQNQIRQRLDAKENVCYPCAIYSADANARQGRLFSEPTHYYRPHGLIVRAELAAEISKRFGNPVDLPLLLQSELRFAFPVQRRYGELQPLLDEHRERSASHLRFETGKDAAILHLQMLSQEQLDVTIDYISSLNYYKRHSRRKLAFLPIAGYQDWLPGAVACPDNSWGQLAVLRVNAVIDKLRQDRALQQNLRFWFGEDLPPYPLDLTH